jgi:hypothetical protein
MKRAFFTFVFLFAAVLAHADNTAYYKKLIVGNLPLTAAATIDTKILKLSSDSPSLKFMNTFSQKVYRITGETNGSYRFARIDKIIFIVGEFRGYRTENIYDLGSSSNVAFIRNANPGFFTNTDVVCRISDKNSFGYTVFEKNGDDYTIKAFYFSEDPVGGE